MSADSIEPGTPFRERHPLFFGPDGLRSGWSLLIYIVLLYGLFYAARIVSHALHHGPRGVISIGVREQSPHDLLLGEAIPFLLISLAAWIMSRIERRPVGEYGLGGPRKIMHFLQGLGWGAAFLSLLVFILHTTGLLVFDRRLLFGTAPLHYALIWFVGFFLVGIFEEYFLRGYLQFTLTRTLTALWEPFQPAHSQRLGFWSAALLLSILFGLGHGHNPGESPIGLLAAGLAGLVFCLSLWRTGSLWWAIGFHAAWDWAQSFVYGVADSGLMVQHHLFATHPVGRPIFSGGATGPEGSLAIVPVLALVAAVILLTLKPETQPRSID